MTPEAFDAVFRLPFQEASDFFREKLNIPTRKWDDIREEQHAHGFMSAGAMKAELLSDLRGAVQKSIDGKMSLKDFQSRFDEIVKTHGWSYKGGRNWRSELIWDTNITTAYQAGRWEQFRAGGTEYLRYVHADGVQRPRPWHIAWSGTTLPIDDPWWGSHYPPNGWRCHCRAVHADGADFASARGLGKARVPESWIDPKTGAPVGIDKGWDYNVGQAARLSMQSVLGEKLAGLPPDLCKRAYADLVGRQTPLTDHWFRQWGLSVLEDRAPSGKVKTDRAMIAVHQMAPEVVEALTGYGHPPETTAVSVSSHDWMHLQHLEQPAAAKRPAASILSREQALELPRLIREGRPVWDSQDDKLLYVLDSVDTGKSSKVVVAVNYRVKGEWFNSVRSAELVEASDVHAGKRYRPIEKK